MKGWGRRLIPDGSIGRRAALGLTVLVLVLNGVGGLVPAFDPGAPSLPTQCVSQVPLIAHSDGTLLRHHQWLETPPHFEGDDLSVWRISPYIVVNTRTGAGYTWNLDSIDRTNRQLRFGVLTRWAWLHPRWASDAWVLLYDCPTSLNS